MDFIKLGDSYYSGFDCCIKVIDNGVILKEVKDNIEYTYYFKKVEGISNFMRGSHYKMSQDIYNQRLIRFIDKIATNYKDFIITDQSKLLITKFKVSGSFRGSLSLDPQAFSHRIIAVSTTKSSSSIEDCDTIGNFGS